MDLDWKRKKINIYDTLYVCENKYEEKDKLMFNRRKQKTRTPYLCNPKEIKIFCRKSYKFLSKKIDNIIINNKIIIMENNNNNLIVPIITNDKNINLINLKYIYKKNINKNINKYI